MVQSYIVRKVIDPRDASKSGADYSICGRCKHRGIATNDPSVKLAKRRTCYVTIGQGPLIVWKAFNRGRYPDAIGADEIASIGADRMVRLGTYGDPAAVPAHIWRALISRAIGHTGYSHQSSVSGAAFDPQTMMISADSIDDAKDAWNSGARTFRIISREDWARDGMAALVKGQETLCPASVEAGNRTTCDNCGLCAGNSISARSVAIVAHGASANLINARLIA